LRYGDGRRMAGGGAVNMMADLARITC